MNAFWRKVLGTIGISVVQSYLERHPELAGGFLDFETALRHLQLRFERSSFKIEAEKHLVGEAIYELEKSWDKLKDNLK